MGNWSGTIKSIKHEVNQVPYEVPGDLEVAIAGFVDYSTAAITKPLAT